MPRCALFYPEWSINDPRFLFESLLYWDRLGCIVPDDNFKPWHWVSAEDEEMTKVLAAANERFVTPYVMTAEQKARAHRRIAEFAIHRAPSHLRPECLKSRDRSLMSARKLADASVELLQKNKWMRESGRNDMNQISSAAGDLVMAALASECGSLEMPPITDDPAGFAASCDLVLDELGISRGMAVSQEKAPSAEDLSLLLESIPRLALEDGRVDHQRLRKLIDAREEPDIAGLRDNFRDKVDEFLAALRTAEEPARQQIRDAFRDAVTVDLESLSTSLRLAGLGTLITVPGVVAVLLGFSVPPIAVVGGLIAGFFAHKKARRENLEKRWSSWLFASEHQRFSIF